MSFNELVKENLTELEQLIYSSIPKKPNEVYGMLPGFIKSGGKRIRPTLALLSCMAVNGEVKKVIKTAALIELFHNFTLIHDDIEDSSQMRRGEPTLNVKYGLPIALNCGDALYTLLWREAAEVSENPKTAVEIQKKLANAFLRVVEGQGVELEWYRLKKIEISEEEYYSMVGGKTGALVALSCEIGAYIGEADKKTCEKLWEFGYKLGIAFQIQDDVLNVVGEFEKYKKEIGGDIREGKRTLMIAKLFEKATPEEKKEVTRILISNTATQKEITQVIEIMKKYGAIDYARGKAKKTVEEAIKSIVDLKDSPAKNALLEIAEFTITREV